MKKRGIILSGGKGTRLYPLTTVVSKQLQPIYDKPMIYFPLTTLILSGIEEILVITKPEDQALYQTLFGDGSQWGLSIRYAPQPEPKGIAQAFLIAHEVGFLEGAEKVMLILGDNLIYGRLDFLRKALLDHEGATIFAYQVKDSSNYGVVEFDQDFRVISLAEKPTTPVSTWAVPGIYIFDPDVVSKALQLTPSARGELEIIDLIRFYLDEGRLSAYPLGRGVAWFDTGTPADLLAASNFVQALEERQGLMVGSPEEAAYRQGFLDFERFKELVSKLPTCTYKTFLERVVRDEGHR